MCFNAGHPSPGMVDKNISQLSVPDGSDPSLVDQSSSTPAVQIQVLQQGQGGNTNTLAMQALLAGQDLSSTQLALANLPANKQQECWCYHLDPAGELVSGQQV